MVAPAWSFSSRWRQDVASKGDPIALRVIADRGDVFEVATAHDADCADYRPPSPYALTVFVPRSVLIPRTKMTLTASHADGTAVVIDHGAPVRSEPLAWRDPLLAATAGTPVAAQLELASPAALAPGPLPPQAGEALVCAPKPQRRADWLVAKRQRAEEERQRAATRRAQRTARPGEPHDPDRDTAANMADLLSAVPDDAADAYAPACGIVDPATAWNRPNASAPLPLLNGRPMPWPDAARSQRVVQVGTGLRADVEVMCGRVRMAVDPMSVGGIGGLGAVGFGGPRWRPRPGKVVWPDGSPAGTYTGGASYDDRELEIRGKLACVFVPGIAERICHLRSDLDH